jgi:predicted nuclease with TOPRIM domain
MDNKVIYLESTLHYLVFIGSCLFLIILYIIAYIIYCRTSLKKAKRTITELTLQSKTNEEKLAGVQHYDFIKNQNEILSANNKELEFQNAQSKTEILRLKNKINSYKEKIEELQSKVEINDDKKAIAFAKLIEKTKNDQ